jgi:hypothetical protein
MRHTARARALVGLLLVALGSAGCDRVFGINRCAGADHIVIDMDTSLAYAVGQVVPLHAHIATASNGRIAADVFWSSALPVIVTVDGATARANFPGHVQIMVSGCGFEARMTFTAVSATPVR